MFDRTQMIHVSVAHLNLHIVTLRVLAPRHGKMGPWCEITRQPFVVSARPQVHGSRAYEGSCANAA